MEIMGDWNSVQYIISQILISIGYCLIAATYFLKSRNSQLAVSITNCVVTGTGFLLLHAWVGAAMCIIPIFRDTTSAIIWNKRSPAERDIIKKSDWFLLTLWLGSLSILTALTQTGFMTLFAFFATATFTISIWQKNQFVYRFLGIFVGIFWIIYNVAVKSFMGLILESILLLFVIAGLITYVRQMKKKSYEYPIK